MQDFTIIKSAVGATMYYFAGLYLYLRALKGWEQGDKYWKQYKREDIVGSKRAIILLWFPSVVWKTIEFIVTPLIKLFRRQRTFQEYIWESIEVDVRNKLWEVVLAEYKKFPSCNYIVVLNATMIDECVSPFLRKLPEDVIRHLDERIFEYIQEKLISELLSRSGHNFLHRETKWGFNKSGDALFHSKLAQRSISLKLEQWTIYRPW